MAGVKNLAPGDLPVAGDLLAAAFMDDPFFRAMVPDPPRRRRWLRVVQTANLRTLLPEGHVYGERDGAAALVPPGRYPLPLVRLLAFFARIAPRSIEGHLPPRSWLRGWRMQDLIDRIHPREPHWYVSVIGVRPEAHGSGLGRRLIEHAIGLAGELPLYLETTNPRNLPFYARFGFDSVGRHETSDGDPVWAMVHGRRSSRIAGMTESSSSSRV
ncbi:MAG: GNAT family N-acetyltransferase [Planctomycetes bacterium]|nr:GNAT family N-acetyltransferase [Planctomycetota bacterium]